METEQSKRIIKIRLLLVFLFDQYYYLYQYILFKLSYLLAYDWQELSDLQYGCRFFDAVVHWLHFFEPMPRDLFDRAAQSVLRMKLGQK